MYLCVCVSPTVVDVLGELADGFGVGQIQQPGNNLGSIHLPHNVTGGLLPLRHVSARQNHPGTYRSPDNSLITRLLMLLAAALLPELFVLMCLMYVSCSLGHTLCKTLQSKSIIVTFVGHSYPSRPDLSPFLCLFRCFLPSL